MLFIFDYRPAPTVMCATPPDRSHRSTDDINRLMSLGSLLNSESPSQTVATPQPQAVVQQTTSNMNTTQVDSGQASTASIPSVDPQAVSNPSNTQTISNPQDNNIVSDLNSTIPHSNPTRAQVDFANTALDQVGNLSKDQIIEIAEQVRPLLDAHVGDKALGNIGVSFEQLAVIKLLMSEDSGGPNRTLLARPNTIRSYGGVIKPGYFSHGVSYKERAMQLKFCGPTNTSTKFYKAFDARLLAYKNGEFPLHIPRANNQELIGKTPGNTGPPDSPT